MTIYVFDTNAVVSAALSPGSMARQALAAARATGTIALSEAVFGEVAAVIARPKFMPVLTADRLSEVLELLAAAALWVEPATKVEDCHHAKDNCYLELALAAGALVIVSGDEDLLVLHPWRGARVLRPSHFVAEIEANP